MSNIWLNYSKYSTPTPLYIDNFMSIEPKPPWSTDFYEICITPASHWSMRNPKTLGSNSKGFQEKAQGSFSKTKFEKQTL